jgi:hypothetical protein
MSDVPTVATWAWIVDPQTGRTQIQELESMRESVIAELEKKETREFFAALKKREPHG